MGFASSVSCLAERLGVKGQERPLVPNAVGGDLWPRPVCRGLHARCLLSIAESLRRRYSCERKKKVKINK